MSSVLAWEERVVIPTYPAPPADRNPMFLDKRVYQGSSGKVYPNPFTDRVVDEKKDKAYQGVFLENEFVRLMILPEIGGRIHIGQDKTNGYDFFYRQNVIKPALVGLLGPWISGGVEFNWPQHHRPSTFMPVEHSIEEHPDGSCTVWLSEHEPMNRMKGMVGICLRPGQALVEAKVRIYNRTPFVQTFLWWANAGIRVHDRYQAFFPPDVAFVADHAKRAMSRYPIARNLYYGVDYTSGVDIAWYKNIPVPTSYMVTKSAYDFFGGYDHAKAAGVVHVANRHIAPGKKLWTWGNADFGYSWDRELTDSDGPYIELMAGVFTDNQPDFSWLHPYETRTFSQYWYPIRDIGPVKNANRLVAVNLELVSGGWWKVGVYATERLENVTIRLEATVGAWERRTTLSPGEAFVETAAVAGEPPMLRVLDSGGRELIRYKPEERGDTEVPEPAKEPAAPAEIATNEELYLTGLHLEQYRHATRYPEPYWQEALRRDPEDTRCHNAMGLLHLRRGAFAQAEEHFRAAGKRLTRLNPNPYDAEPSYHLGLTLRYQGRPEEAYASFYRAAWNYAWQAAAYYELAAIDCCRGEFTQALDHLNLALRTNADHLQARNLKAAVLRKLGLAEAATAFAEETNALDPLDAWSQSEISVGCAVATMNDNVQLCLDLALDYAHAGMYAEASDVIECFRKAAPHAAHPMLDYTAGYLAERAGDADVARERYRDGAAGKPDYCFPSRLEELLVLTAALQSQPDDARAHYYLGNLLYDKLQREEAIAHWEQACALDRGFSIPWRNLGIAYYNIRRDADGALECYRKAREANPPDARLLYEHDQLSKRTGAPPEKRLAELERHRALVDQRDDLTVELVTLYNRTGASEKALEILDARRFHPWEGGEGLVSGQYVAAHVFLTRRELDAGNPANAKRHLDAARCYPQNLGEGKHLLTRETHLDYLAGEALSLMGRTVEAEAAWRAAAADDSGDWLAYYRGMALRALGEEPAAAAVFQSLLTCAETGLNSPPKVDYFATSLPNFLLFEDDLSKRNLVHCLFLRGLAKLGLGQCNDASKDLGQALELDRNHLWAAYELGHIRQPRWPLASVHQV